VAAPEMSPPKRGATDPKSVDPPVARPQPIQDDGTHSAPQDGHFHQLPHGKITSDVLQEGDISPLELQLQHARKDAGGLVQLQEQEDAHFQKHGEFHPGGEGARVLCLFSYQRVSTCGQGLFPRCTFLLSSSFILFAVP
jgi:hypothetical protein